MKVKILSYNIHGGRGCDGQRDYQRIGALLKEHDIDIALIQELDTRPYRENTEKAVNELRTDHFDHFIAAPTLVTQEGWYGNAIFSKFPILKKNIIDISTKGREPRNILEVFLQSPEGLLHVVNTHKGLKSAERGLQMAKLNDLLSRASDIPLIVGGDINEWQSSSASLKKLNSVLHELGTGATFPTMLPVFRLDRMWCRPAGIFRAIKVLKTKQTRQYSDHYPLFAEIEI
ncbi:hypothetical protein AZI86_13865 [Bdellovibrio bacteriovorus]|uniref:Endonuclease/exonuclease/phosphatase domain-containing protein n=1 Tax=Bdellovibrio bacteriovorus TaxID=959 RepID=A0A150WJG5_BDEBC|nr:endonuclease/exonuclease/phosphatase family protein [Bdellovibrio bacteriovorus]KYG63899.1 hypothetical protein AZI86_13865 [Bdellovibrio bacteriovorus]